MKLFLLLHLVFFSLALSAQIKGTIRDNTGRPLQSVSISIENSYLGTSSNTSGYFEIKAPAAERYTLRIKSLGYKSKTIHVYAGDLPVDLQVILTAEAVDLEEVFIGRKTNPADDIIRKAILQRNKNAALHDSYTADFYAKGSFWTQETPKKILGIKLDDEDLDLDSTRSGIVYLSETVSQLTVQRPLPLIEKIVASKTSGNSNGFSFNRARGSEFDLYRNYLSFGSAAVISPIADQAFSYYSFTLLQSFEEAGQTIHQLKIKPKRSSEPVFEGTVYIVADSWEIYAADLLLLGQRISQPVLDSISIKQQYSYHDVDKRWSKQQQLLDVRISLLGFKLKGHFTQNFSNYNYAPTLRKTNEKVLAEFVSDANKKDSIYWSINRKTPLSQAEEQNYRRMDSIERVHSSTAYIDSMDRIANRFSPLQIFTGYRYRNTASNYSIYYKSLLNPMNLSFNYVQGWTVKTSLGATIGKADAGKYTQLRSTFTYGFADQKLYVNTGIKQRFNTKNYATLQLNTGVDASMFNENLQALPHTNLLAHLLFDRSYIQLYKNTYVNLIYSQFLHPDIKVKGQLGYFDRGNLYNATRYTSDDNPVKYPSNNPLSATDYHSTPFLNHHLTKVSLAFDFSFNSKIDRLPKRDYIMEDTKTPKIQVSYSQGFGASIKDYNYQEVMASIKQDVTLGNKGVWAYHLSAGTFFNGANMSFIDYKHFNGNRTHMDLLVGNLNSFLNLPYYSHSTNHAYLEWHTAYNFKGYILNKIPGIRALGWQTVVGYHGLSTKNTKPYQEVTVGFDKVGFGKFRPFRVDYVRSMNARTGAANGIMVSMSILELR